MDSEIDSSRDMITLQVIAERPRETVDSKPKNFLSPSEMKAFLEAARGGRYGVRDYCMVLMAYRHGLRVGELVKFRLDDVDLDAGRAFIRRQKGSMSTNHPMDGDEIRAVRAWMRRRAGFAHKSSPLLFLSERGPMCRQAFTFLCRQIAGRMKPTMHVHPHMLRHSCGYALANMGKDTRLIQDYLGHREIKNTEVYTRTTAKRFEGLWG